MAKPKFFGEGIPYLDQASLNLKGKLIVIEGTDAVGRSTQVERLRKGYGRGRYSLCTGDIGAALYAADCIDRTSGYPIFDGF